MPLHTRLRRALDLPLETGVLAVEVAPGGPAARAGVLSGDIILGFGGTKLGSVDDLHRVLSGEHAGQQSVLEILRRGERHQLTVTPEEAS